MTPEQVAALLDGEGCIHSNVPKDIPSPEVLVGMTERVYPDLLLKQFGGSLYLVKSGNPKWSDCWRWQIRGKSCREIMEFVLPHLKIKRLQAELVLAMITTIAGKGSRITDKDALFRWILHEKLLELNQKGPK